MKSLASSLWLLVVLGVSTGCATRTAVRPEPSAAAGETAVASSVDADTYVAVTVSARYVRFLGELPAARGELAFLDDVAGLKTAGLVMSPARAEVALKAFGRATNQDVFSTPVLTVKEGGTARMSCTQTFMNPESVKESTVSVTVGGRPVDFQTREVGLVLEATPRVQDDGRLLIDTKIEQTTFEGFVDYGGTEVSLNNGTTVKVPTGFYQPIFSTRSVDRSLRLLPGEIVVFLAPAEGEPDADGSAMIEQPMPARLFTNQPERWLVFLTAGTAREKRSPAM